MRVLSRLSAAGCLPLAACLPITYDTGSGASAAEPEAAVAMFSASCATTLRFEAAATVTGAAVNRAILDIWDSGVPQGWHETHPFAVESTDGGATDTAAANATSALSMALAYTLTQADVGDSGPGVGQTWLSCQPNAVFDLGLATYALRAYADETLVACAAYGFDPGSVSAGTYSVYGGSPPAPEELAGCDVGSGA